MRSFASPRMTKAALLLTLAAACGDPRKDALANLHGIKLEPPVVKPDFTLEDTQGQPFHFRRDTRDMVTLLYFGYTNCPDVCPAHMTNIANALKKLSAEDQRLVRVVFVTTDPERDTPEHLRQWLDNFDKRFIGLRGDVQAINRIGAGLGLPPATRETMNDMPGMAAVPHANYGVGHAAQVLAFSPDDTLRTEYPGGFMPADWENDLRNLVKIR